MLPRCSLPYSQQPDTYSYREQVQTLPVCLFNVHFSIVLPSMPRSCAQISVHFLRRYDVWTCWLWLGHWFLAVGLVSAFRDTNQYLNISVMEELVLLLTETQQVQNVNCEQWTVNGPDVHQCSCTMGQRAVKFGCRSTEPIAGTDTQHARSIHAM